MSLIIYFLIAYIYGSIPYAFIFTYFFKRKKLFNEATKNVGIANAFQQGGLKAGLLSVAGEVSKILVPLIYGKILGLERFVTYGAMLIAVIGTMYPIFLMFRGGKGRTVAGSAVFFSNPFAGLIIFGIWGVTISLTKKAKLSSIIGSLSITPIMIIFKTNFEMLLFSVALTLLFLMKNEREKNDFIHYGITK